MKDPFDSSEVELPSRFDQMHVIRVFVKIVRTQRTFEGKVWWPAEILTEMWRLWGERPKEKGRYSQFKDRYYERVRKLREGRTKGKYVEDGLFFDLIHRFVRKHAEPSDLTLPGRDIELILNTANYIDQFFYGEISRAYSKNHLVDELSLHDELRKFSTPATLQSSPIRAVFQLLKIHANEPSEISEMSSYDKKRSELVVVGGTPLENEKYLPLVIVNRQFAKVEVGFLSLSTNCSFTRATVAGAHELDGIAVGGVHLVMPYARILHFQKRKLKGTPTLVLNQLCASRGHAEVQHVAISYNSPLENELALAEKLITQLESYR